MAVTVKSPCSARQPWCCRSVPALPSVTWNVPLASVPSSTKLSEFVPDSLRLYSPEFSSCNSLSVPSSARISVNVASYVPWVFDSIAVELVPVVPVSVNSPSSELPVFVVSW